LKKQPTGQTILVVEDEPLVAHLVSRVLNQQGYRVLTAISGTNALEIWNRERHRIDLLLTDMVMPGGMSGQELASRLQQDRPALRVIYSSGYSIEALGSTFKLTDKETFLMKPYDVSVLTDMIRERLQEGGTPPGPAGGPPQV
jgi:CheY-like chemotaxis protein